MTAKWGTPAVPTSPRTVPPALRVLTTGDERALELFLQRHRATSVTLMSNIKAAGLENLGQPFQGTYFAAWEGATIVGVAAHFNDSVIVLQAPRAVNQIVRGVVAASKRDVAGIQGPWPQVEAAVASLGFARDKMVGKAQMLSTLDLSKLMLPEIIKRGQVKVREAVSEDFDKLLPWHSASYGERVDAIAVSDVLRQQLQRQIEAKAVFVAETDRPVAMASFEIWQGEAVKIGAIYTPPALKDKGYGRAAIAGALALAQKRGVARAIILCDKSDAAGQRAFDALGFTALSDYGVLRRPQ